MSSALQVQQGFSEVRGQRSCRIGDARRVSQPFPLALVAIAVGTSRRRVRRLGPLVTATVAEQMALGVARLLGAEVAVSVTGAAGPEPLDGAEPGTVVVGVLLNGSARSFSHFFRGAPDEICRAARDAALRELLDALRNTETSHKE